MVCESPSCSATVCPSRRSLNPCFSGIWSVSLEGKEYVDWESVRLNPCFSGIWSVRDFDGCYQLPYAVVLILVLVEYGL